MSRRPTVDAPHNNDREGQEDEALLDLGMLELHDQGTVHHGKERRVSRWVHADVLDRAQARLDKKQDAMRTRRATVEHPFGTLKSWMGATHFQMKTLPRVSTEMSLHVLAYNMKRAINLLGTKEILAAIRA
jgi:hypothetical protein